MNRIREPTKGCKGAKEPKRGLAPMTWGASLTDGLTVSIPTILQKKEKPGRKLHSSFVDLGLTSGELPEDSTGKDAPRRCRTLRPVSKQDVHFY